VDAASNTDVDFVLSSKLSTLTKGATLELTLERWGVGESGRAIIQEWDDVLRLDEDDEWALQAGLVRVASRFVRQAMREVIVQPAAELQRDPARANRLANAAHDRLLGGTSKHMFSCIHMIRNALEDNAYSARAYSCLAEAMVRKYLMWDGDEAFLAEAREFANRSLALHHECAEAHTSLGFAYQHSGAPTDAERDYRIAIQIDPTEWMAHSYLGALLARGGNFRHALDHLEQALKIRPQSIGSADNLYLVHMRLGNTDTAITVAKAGIESGLGQLLKCKDDQETRTQTALLHARIGESREAVELINTARELYPKDGFTNFRIACVHAALGEFDDAIRDLTAARDRRDFIRGELLGGTDLEVLRSLPGFDDLLG
jgi:adenylate cyclase